MFTCAYASHTTPCYPRELQSFRNVRVSFSLDQIGIDWPVCGLQQPISSFHAHIVCGLPQLTSSSMLTLSVLYLQQVLDVLAEVAFEAEFLTTRIEKERRAVMAEAQMMNTIEYRVDCQLLQYLHEENALGFRFPIGKMDQVGFGF